MKWTIIFVIITAIYSILAFYFDNWKQPKKKYKRALLLLVLIIASTISIFLEIKSYNQDKYKSTVESGQISSKWKYLSQFYVNIGRSTQIEKGSVFVEHGVFDINQFIPIPNINAKNPKEPLKEYPFSGYGLDLKF